MNNVVRAIIFTGIGVGIGIAATRKYFDKKYKKRSDEEIESTRQAFGKTIKDRSETETSNNDSEDKKSQIHEKSTLDDYKNIIETRNYSTMSDKEMVDTLKEKYKKTEPEPQMEMKPRIIRPEELGQNEEYEVISLTYYDGDDTLADDVDEAINDIDAIVGEEALESFGTYEDDAVHVVNDERRCYYEILRDYRSWGEVTGRMKENIDES